MNSTTTHRSTRSRQLTGSARARRAGALSVAGALAALTLAPTITHAAQSTGDGGASTRAGDIDDVVAARKEQMARDLTRPATRSQPSHSVSAARDVFTVRSGCDIPQTLDKWSRRLIAVQVCSQAELVPAARARVGYLIEPATSEVTSVASGGGVVGHCGHHALHQPPGVASLPVSAWFTPTSC